MAGFVAAHFEAFEGEIFSHQLGHLALNQGEILRDKTVGQVEIVIEAAIRGRANVQLDILVQPAYSGRHDMRRTMAQKF